MVLPNSCESDLWSRKWESHEPDTKFAKLSWIETFVNGFKNNGVWFYISNYYKGRFIEKAGVLHLKKFPCYTWVHHLS